jgi:heterodisulfide reductase subunit A-like polyferredoxin
MSPVTFICTTPGERAEDLESLGGHLEGMGYEVHLHRDLCSPQGQRFIAERPPDDDKMVLVCPRKLPRQVFDSVLDQETEYFSFEMEGEPKELASSVHSEVILAAAGRVLGTSPMTNAMVIGGGVAGVYAALDISAQGFEVMLVESDPSIGGIMAALDKTFPTMDCSI